MPLLLLQNPVENHTFHHEDPLHQNSPGESHGGLALSATRPLHEVKTGISNKLIVPINKVTSELTKNRCYGINNHDNCVPGCVRSLEIKSNILYFAAHTH